MDENLWEIPVELIRYWTGAAIDVLAKRFNLPNTPAMQDWAWEVADSCRLDEFLTAYDSGELNDDERFVLMDMLIQSAEELGHERPDHPAWAEIQQRLDQDINLHIYTVCYWACLDSEDLEDAFEVAPVMRALLKKYKHRFALPDQWDERLSVL